MDLLAEATITPSGMDEELRCGYSTTLKPHLRFIHVSTVVCPEDKVAWASVRLHVCAIPPGSYKDCAMQLGHVAACPCNGITGDVIHGAYPSQGRYSAGECGAAVYRQPLACAC